MFMWVLGHYAVSTVLLVSKGLLEGADCIGGQLHGDKECLFSGITNSGRVWRKVPESDAGSVSHTHTHTHPHPLGVTITDIPASP